MRNHFHKRSFMHFSQMAIIISATLLALSGEVSAAETESVGTTAPQLEFGELIQAGGPIGYTIIGLSICMLALIVEHILSIRRNALMPPGLSEQVHQLIAQGQIQQAVRNCHQSRSFLGHILAAGLMEVGLGYTEVEKSMEDSATEQAARLFRKIEYLSIIGTIAPMLGLLGTVWGMILAFMEFQLKANPQVAELAPGIYKALVTTLLGLGVAVPALASFALFRNRIDELVAESSLLAEHVFADFKRALLARRKNPRQQRDAGGLDQTAPRVPSVTQDREQSS